MIGYGICTASTQLNVRSTPSVTAPIKGQLRGQEVVILLGVYSPFYQIIHPSIGMGYCAMQNIAILSEYGTLGWVNVSSTLNVRTGPNTTFPVSFTVSKHDAVTITQSSSGWYLIKAPGGMGWCSSDYIVIGTPPSQAYDPTELILVREGVLALSSQTGSGYANAIKHLQLLLRSKGYTSVTANGSYDAATRSAIVSVQNTYGLLADGVCGMGVLGVLEDDGNMSGWFTSQGTCKLTAGKLARCGFTNKSILKPDGVAALNAAINRSDFGFISKTQIRHFLAQGYAESNAAPDLLEFGHNSELYKGFYGAGFMQLTRDYNYAPFDQWLRDTGYQPYYNIMLADVGPKRVAQYYPFLSAGWYFSNANVDKAINTKILTSWAELSAFETVTNVSRSVYGGTDEPKEAQRFEYYERIKGVLL